MADEVQLPDTAVLPSTLSAPNGTNGPRQKPARSHQPLSVRLRPTPITALVGVLAVLLKQRSRRRLNLPEPVKWVLLILGVANWRALPFVWSLRLAQLIPWAWFRYAVLGKKILNPIIAKSPFDATSVTTHVASWNACDFMMHLSNSSYAYSLDKARTQWSIRFLGGPQRRDLEHVTWMVAATQFTYFNEIPMLAEYQVETRPAAWDHKWLYLIHRFTTAPAKGSNERFLNCIAITRIVFKLGRRTAPPARVLALTGFGPDRSNYERTGKMRQDSAKRYGGRRGKLGREWLLEAGTPSGCECFEEQSRKQLEVVRRSLDGSAGADELKSL